MQRSRASTTAAAVLAAVLAAVVGTAGAVVAGAVPAGASGAFVAAIPTLATASPGSADQTTLEFGGAPPGSQVVVYETNTNGTAVHTQVFGRADTSYSGSYTYSVAEAGTGANAYEAEMLANGGGVLATARFTFAWIGQTCAAAGNVGLWAEGGSTNLVEGSTVNLGVSYSGCLPAGVQTLEVVRAAGDQAGHLVQFAPGAVVGTCAVGGSGGQASTSCTLGWTPPSGYQVDTFEAYLVSDGAFIEACSGQVVVTWNASAAPPPASTTTTTSPSATPPPTAPPPQSGQVTLAATANGVSVAGGYVPAGTTVTFSGTASSSSLGYLYVCVGDMGYYDGGGQAGQTTLNKYWSFPMSVDGATFGAGTHSFYAYTSEVPGLGGINGYGSTGNPCPAASSVTAVSEPVLVTWLPNGGGGGGGGGGGTPPSGVSMVLSLGATAQASVGADPGTLSLSGYFPAGSDVWVQSVSPPSVDTYYHMFEMGSTGGNEDYWTPYPNPTKALDSNGYVGQARYVAFDVTNHGTGTIFARSNVVTVDWTGAPARECVKDWNFAYGGRSIAVAPGSCRGGGQARFRLVCDGAGTTETLTWAMSPPLAGSQSATETAPACAAGTLVPPGPPAWSRIVGPVDWPANGATATVNFYASSPAALTWDGFSSYGVTNYPPNTWHVAPVAGQSALDVNLYQASEAAGAGSAGPYHVAAAGSYTLSWGPRSVTFAVVVPSCWKGANTPSCHLHQTESVSAFPYNRTYAVSGGWNINAVVATVSH